MTEAIDDTISDLIEKLKRSEADSLAADSGQGPARAGMQEPPDPSRQSDQRRATRYGRIATATIVLVLVATGASYYLYREEREAITSRIDTIVRAPVESPLEQRLQVLEKKFVDAGSVNEKRLQTIEQGLTDNRQEYQQQFQDMGQRLEQIHEPQERRLQRVEQRLEGLQQPDRKRLQSIENRLVQITARMDGWAAVVADLSNDDQSVTTVNAATVAEPPATRPIEPVMVAHNDTVLQQPPAVAESAQGQPLLAAAALSAHGGQGDWVINIGSYLRERIAAGKLAEFREQGVTAELVTATVRGKTIYRIQVPGFASRAGARDHARQVQATLGLEETWIRRR